MTDNSFAGPMSMIRINGSKIKQLREQQGLTQLYLATAVEVTTDTISRWENRRYPSIKRDNGLKLAEALNVQLDDLLEETSENTAETPHSSIPPSVTPPKIIHSKFTPKRLFLIVLGTILCIAMTFIWIFVHSSQPLPFSAKRILPAHCIDGQPFPVLIEVTGAPDVATAIIIKESLPMNGIIHTTSPKVTSGALRNNEIRWLKKITSAGFFAYVVSVSGKDAVDFSFTGTAAISHDSESSIDGKNTIAVGQHHWADSNKDNIISDDEILAVYDLYSEITDIDLNIDFIEEIWLGSEYSWDSATATYKIID